MQGKREEIIEELKTVKRKLETTLYFLEEGFSLEGEVPFVDQCAQRLANASASLNSYAEAKSEFDQAIQRVRGVQ